MTPQGSAKAFVLYQALYDYTSREDGDLNFLAGEIIRVTDEGM